MVTLGISLHVFIGIPSRMMGAIRLHHFRTPDKPGKLLMQTNSYIGSYTLRFPYDNLISIIRY